jgi:hypothetical protein
MATRGIVPVAALVAVAALLAPAPASAQPARPAEDAAERLQAQADAELKAQIGSFSYVLRDAVERGGQRLAEWAGRIVPGIELALAANPAVEATPLPDGSLLFDVRVPEIMQTSMMLFSRQAPQAGSVPVNRGGAVRATGVVADDPLTGVATTPNQQYSDYVREALIEALIDSSRILSVENGQWLTVAAIGVDVAVVNPLYRNTSRKLILSIKGDDLLTYRRGDISRDEVKTRIHERRF